VKNVNKMLIEFKYSNIPLYTCNGENIIFEFNLKHME